MRKSIDVAMLSLSCLLTIEFAHAAAPTCQTHLSGSYCRYIGQVAQEYINADGHVILCFDTTMSSSLPASVGISGVTVLDTASFNLNTNIEFGKALYASMLSAQAREVTVVVHMKDVVGGYLQIDRIWVRQ